MVYGEACTPEMYQNMCLHEQALLCSETAVVAVFYDIAGRIMIPGFIGHVQSGT